MNPSVSIIMPVFNAKEHLSKTITSILSQDFESFELIIVNDGSTDGSLAICKEFADKDARVKIINQKNSGTSAARNTGLNVAKGKYITFCDHDDEYLPHLLRDNFELAEKKQVDVLQFSINRIDTTRQNQIISQRLNDYSIDSGDIRNKYLDIRLTENFMDVWNHFYLRSSIQHIRFNAIYRHGREDLDFNLNVLKQIKKGYLFSSNIYYNHYFYKNSSSNSFSPKITKEIEKEYNTLFQIEYEFLMFFQSNKFFSTSKATQILIHNLDFLHSKVEFQSVSELKGFYKSPLFSHIPFRLPLKIKLYLWAFFNSSIIFKFLNFLSPLQSISTAPKFENTTLYGFFLDLFNSPKGRFIFNFCNFTIKFLTLPFRLKNP